MIKSVKKILFFISSLILLLAFTGCTSQSANTLNETDKPIVAVSIVPQATFVNEVAGGRVQVVTLIPPGKSPENYAPSPLEIEQFSKASLYFTVGVPTEEANILPKTKDLNENLTIVHLEDKVGQHFPHRYFEDHDTEGNYSEDSHVEDAHGHEGEDPEIEEGHHHEGRDPHIWLSPKRVKVMVEEISKELSSLDPKNQKVYEKNAQDYMKKLDALDEEIQSSLKALKNKTFIVYHPSFGYFADDYGLTMLSLEEEGKDATAKNLQKLIDRAKDENIKAIFYQAEVDSKQSKTFASEIGGKAEQINPLASDYIENLRKTAKTFKSFLEE